MLLSLIIIGTIAYSFLEGWPLVTSFYFAVTTLSTVGYGDLYPTNDLSRLFTSFYILTGVAVALASLTIIGNHYLSKHEGRIIEKRKNR